MRLCDDGNACVALDEEEVGPCPEEEDFAGEAVLGVFRHGRSLFIYIGQEVVHPVDPLVGAVPDVEDCGTGIVRLTAFLHVHHVVRVHIAGGDVTGRGAAVAEVAFVGDTSYVTLLVRVRKHGVECVHIGFGKGVAVEYGVFVEFVKRLLIQESVMAGYKGKSDS